MNQSAEALIKRAEAKDMSDPKEALEAVKLYRRYRSYRPNDLDGFAKYATVCADLANPETGGQYYLEALNALNQLINGLETRPEELRKLTEKLIQLNLKFHVFADARNELIKLKAQGKTNGDLDYQLARCHVATGHYDDAVKILSELIGFDADKKTFDATKATAPKEVEAYVLLTMVLRDKLSDSNMPDRIAVADQVMDQLVDANPDSAKALLQAALYQRERGQRDRAKDLVAKALTIAPDDADVLQQAAEVALQSNDIATAEKWIAKGIELHPDNDRFYRLSVTIAEYQRNSVEAQSRLDKALAQLPNSPDLLGMSMNRQIQTGDLNGARVTLKKIDSLNKFNPGGRDLLVAKLMMADGDFLQASKKLEAVRPKLVNQIVLAQQADMALMACYNRLGQPDLALAAAQRSPDSPEAQLGMVIALRALGKPSEALEHFQRIAGAIDPSKQFEGASRLGSQFIELMIDEQSQKPPEQQSWERVEKRLDALRQKEVVKDPVATLLELDILTHKGELDKAQDLATSLLAKFPKELNVITAAANIALQNKKPEEAQKILGSAPEEFHNHPSLIGYRIQCLLASGAGADEIKAGLEAINAEVDKLPTEAKAQIYSVIGIAYLQIGDRDNARQQWMRAAELQPRNTRIRLLLFGLARDTGDLPKMKEILDWFQKEQSSDTAQCKLLEASVLVASVRASQVEKTSVNPQQNMLDETDKQNLLKARGLLQEVANLRPGWVEQPRAMALIEVLEGNIDRAIDDLQQVLKLGAPTPDTIKQLAQFLHYRNRDDEALKVLDTYGSLVVGDQAIKLLRAEIEVRTGHADEALKIVTSEFNKDSKDPMQHVTHGRLLMEAGQPAEAEKELRQAVELGPEVGEAWLRLIQVLVAEKKGQEALETAQEAQIKLPEDRRAFILAHAYETLGDPQQAETQFLSALSAMPDNLMMKQEVAQFYLRPLCLRPDKSQQYLDQIMQAKPSNPAERAAVSWARRVSAQLLAADGDYQHFVKAMQLLSPPDEIPGIDDLLAQIKLLDMRADPASTRKALELFDQLKKQRALSWDERLIKAKLLERIGDWPAASDEMRALLSLPKPDPSIYVQFAEMLLRRGAADEAVNTLQALGKSGVKPTPQLYLLTARALTMQGKGAQAAALLMGLLPADRPLPREQWPMLRLLAGGIEQGVYRPGYLETIGQFEQAEKLLREEVELDPSQSAALASFLAARGKVDTLIEFVDKNQSKLALPQILQIVEVALRQSPTRTDEQIKRVEEWFKRAKAEDPDSIPVQMLWCDFLDMQQRLPEVEKEYRAILARTDIPSTTRAEVDNNLAFLLAMQGRNPDEALKLIDEAINLFGPQSDMLDTRGVVYLSKGDVKQALSDLSDCVISTEPKPTQLVHLAMAQTAAQQEPAARRTLDRAKELKFNPDELSPLEKAKYQEMLKKLNITE
jgi:tetratricopeptide (TPR) repeat protein